MNDVVDELIGAKNFFDQRTEETYNKYNLYRGKSVRINNELVLTIYVKDNDDDYCRYKKYDDLCLEVTNKTGEIENLLNKLHKKIFQSNEIDIEQNLLMIAEIWERNQDFFNRFQDALYRSVAKRTYKERRSPSFSCSPASISKNFSSFL